MDFDKELVKWQSNENCLKVGWGLSKQCCIFITDTRFVHMAECTYSSGVYTQWNIYMVEYIYGRVYIQNVYTVEYIYSRAYIVVHIQRRIYKWRGYTYGKMHIEEYI